MISNTNDDVFGHAHGHVTNTEKMQRLPGKLLSRDFFHCFKVIP